MSHAADVLRALRALVRRPAFLLLASATLALGVAALVGTFTLLAALVLRPPPWPNHARLVVYGARGADDPMRSISPRLYDAVGLPASIVSRGVVRRPETVNVVDGPRRELLRAQRVDAGFLPTLGVIPGQGGKGAAAGDGVLLSYGLWRRWLAGEQGVAGRPLLVDGRPMTVRGVLPAGYRFFADVDLVLPWSGDPGDRDGAENMTAVALLAPGRDARDVSADVARVAASDPRLRETDLRWYGATPADELAAHGSRGSLWLFAGCALLVLAVAGANVSHLMSTRMFGRIHETALAMVFGGQGWRPWLPALTDALGVGLAACAVGVPAGFLLVRFFGRYLPSAWRVSALPPAPDARVLAVVFAFTLAVVLLAAVSGAMRVQASLLRREQAAMGGIPGVGRSTGRTGPAMVMAQMALATLLVSLGAAAVSRAWRLARTPAGFDATGAVVVELHVPVSPYPQVADVLRLVEAIQERALRLPGVHSVGWTTQLPTGRGYRMPFLHAGGTREFAQYALTTIDGNRGMGLRKLAGRWLHDGDVADAEPVALVNETYLRHFASRGVGDVVRPAGTPAASARIVGVVGDTWRDADGAPQPAVFLPLAQADARRFALVRGLAPLYAVVRGPLAAAVARGALPRIVGEVAPSLALSAPVPLERVAHAPLAAARRNVALFSTLSAFAVGLAAVGQYSVQAVEVAATRDAIALRGALGAAPLHLFGRVLRKALRVALGGIALGLLGTRVLQHWPYAQDALPGGVGWEATAIAALVMALATVAAAFVPARRAAAVEPWRVLRSD